MTVEHSTNVALILSHADNTARCGLIHRHPRRTTTFSFTATTSNNSEKVVAHEIVAVLDACADFLESIQICYAIATESAKGAEQDFEKEVGLKARLGALRKNLDHFDGAMQVTYRPERPDMNRFLQEAQLLLSKRARA